MYFEFINIATRFQLCMFFTPLRLLRLGYSNAANVVEFTYVLVTKQSYKNSKSLLEKMGHGHKYVIYCICMYY